MIKKINHNWVNTLLIVAVGILVLVGGNQPGQGGTRYPSGLSADSTSPSAGEVRGTTLTTTGLATLSSATLSSTLAVTGATTLATVTTITAGDLVLTDGRIDMAISASSNDCSSNAVTLDLSSASSTQGVIQSDQLSGACAITFSNGVAGELVTLDLTYGGDTAWTIAAGGHYIADTFDESACIDFQSTAANSDHLILTGIMTDANTIMPLSCYYVDQ